MRLAPAFVLVLAACTPAVVAPPKAPTPSDRDGDHVVDTADQCPDQAEDFDGWKDEDGCPDPDNDGDGIPDVVDKCPSVPEDKDGFQDDDGCPDPDNDGDGIADVDDQCPNEPETYNGYEDEDGCPDKNKVVIVSSNPPIVSRVEFDKDSSTVKATAVPVLDAVVTTLAQHPEVVMVQIEGHGDAKESPKVAQARADAVLKWLVQKGADAKRLRAKGFAAHCPLDVKPEPNRRVEFKVVRLATGPTSVELGCAPATAAGVVSDPK
ncbi:MAG: OmpA family protein [Myxococcales bacterium]|nr:OmpA family protein [Myxococcales bacterium]